MPRVSGPKAPKVQKHCDVTPPPRPEITRSIAFDRGSPEARIVNSNAQASRPRAVRDPVYIELGNVEAGTTIEMINLSAKPDAAFDCESTLKLPLTGRDIKERQAAVYLNENQLNELGLKAGDMYKLRVVDKHGLASEAVVGELEPDDWANQRVQDVVDNARVTTRGSRITALDGEAVRKNFIAKAINDTRPPMMLDAKLALDTIVLSDSDKKTLGTLAGAAAELKEKLGTNTLSESRLKQLVENTEISDDVRAAGKKLLRDKKLFANVNRLTDGNNVLTPAEMNQMTKHNRTVFLMADTAVEPRTNVEVFNTRTGETFETFVDDDQKLNVRLNNVENGDTLLVTPRDNEGVEGKAVELHYSDCAKDGRAQTHNILGARLSGVI